ncbi:hypothetical protein ACIBI9_40440 [Nonomuraea sp. NPDC050451]|uniref:hypothetical protein n=1 Tax=Nonomuraea sp. NPDC050451 TaxID=3364364 RepID=UPI0037B446D8
MAHPMFAETGMETGEPAHERALPDDRPAPRRHSIWREPTAAAWCRTRPFKLVVNPESVNELHDLEEDPSELTDRYGDPALGEIQSALMHRLYQRLRASGDNFHHWMTSMYAVGGKDYDTSLSDFEGADHQGLA